jgi:FkbM family methyltransferase
MTKHAASSSRSKAGEPLSSMRLLDIASHPKLAFRKARGRLARAVVRIPSHPVILSLKGGPRFEVASLPFLDADDVRSMLTGSYDLDLCHALGRILRRGDIFIDVGANVGYVSAVAASLIGKEGEVHGFEPLPECFGRLRSLASLNPEYAFHFHNVALGDRDGVLPIVYNQSGESREATLVPGKSGTDRVDVPVRRLDAYLNSSQLDLARVRAVKIDVEGFEFPVLLGMESLFAHRQFRPWVVCEVKPWEIAKIGHSMTEFAALVERIDYIAVELLRNEQRIELASLADFAIIVLKPRGRA